MRSDVLGEIVCADISNALRRHAIVCKVADYDFGSAGKSTCMSLGGYGIVGPHAREDLVM